MKNVDFDTLKSAVKGALRIYESERELVLRRFTKKQEEHFDKTLNYVNKPQKAKASTSMVIDFLSTTERVELSAVCLVATTRKPCYFDVYCNGELVCHKGYNGLKNKQVKFCAKLPKGEKRVTIYLPNLFEVHVQELKIDENAELAPYKNSRRFLFLGDSITQGYVAKYPSKTYVNGVSKAFDAQVLNLAIGGAYFLADDLDEELSCYNPDTVFIAYGTNDWAHGYDVENTATEYFIKLKSIFRTSNFVYISPIWRGDVKRKKSAKIPFERLGDLIEEVCKKVGDIKVVRGDNLVGKARKNFIKDILHPNDKGFIEYTNNLLYALKELGV